MFESFVPDSGKSLDPSLNNSLTGFAGNLEPMDCITPQYAVTKLTPGGSSPELFDTTLRSPGSDDSSILLPKSFFPQSVDAPATNPSSVDPLTGMGAQVPEIVEQAVQLTYDVLTEFAISSDFGNKMNLAFGNSFDTKIADAIANKFAQGDFSDLPEVEILSAATMNGANGAFSEETNKIYLSSEVVAKNVGNVDAIAGVLLEEIGHDIDSKINVKDAAGDEGNIFARVVQGKEISAGEFVALKAEDDTATITLNGQTVQIEQAKPKPGGDRVIDFLRQERGSWVDGSNDAQVWLSKGDWTFNSRTELPNMSAMNGDFVNLIAGDFDGNGLTDFIRQEKGAWVNGINDAQVFLANGKGTFKSPIQMTDMNAMNGNFVNLVAGDFNGDSKTDIIRQEKGAWVDGRRDAEIYISNGDGTFRNPILMNNASAMNGDFVNLIVGDFTGGGADDIIRQEKGNWVNGVNDVEFYTFSNGNFGKVKDVPDMGAMNGNFVNLVAGDFNGDRVTDLIRQEKGSWVDGRRDAEIYMSNGNWGFKSIAGMNNASAMNGDFVNLIVGDLTGGGADDIIRQEKGNWVNGVNDVEFLTYSNSNFVKVKDAPNMSDLNGNYVTLVPGLFGSSSDNPPISSGDRLSQLANKPSPLTIDEIKEYRQLVTQKPNSEQSGWYRTLQYKLPYFNQRDNSHRDIADVMCNVTTLASCLTSLGVKNPTPSKQFEDVLEDILRSKPNDYPSFQGLNARYWWSNLSKLATNEFGVASSGVQSLQGFATTDVSFFKNFVKDKWEPALNQGKAIMSAVATTSAGHIVKIVDIKSDGIIVDDPYGKAKDTPGDDAGKFNYSGSQNSTIRGSVNTQQGQNEEGIGNDNLWSWSYCAEIFGATPYLILG